MSGRTGLPRETCAVWRQPVYSTFTLTVNELVGRLPSDQDSPLRTRTGDNNLTCGKGQSAILHQTANMVVVWVCPRVSAGTFA
eukprot:1374228-Prymnesium_polylepis.1